jgi:hypothetical protein
VRGSGQVWAGLGRGRGGGHAEAVVWITVAAFLTLFCREEGREKSHSVSWDSRFGGRSWALACG